MRPPLRNIRRFALSVAFGLAAPFLALPSSYGQQTDDPNADVFIPTQSHKDPKQGFVRFVGVLTKRSVSELGENSFILDCGCTQKPDGSLVPVDDVVALTINDKESMTRTTYQRNGQYYIGTVMAPRADEMGVVEVYGKKGPAPVAQAEGMLFQRVLEGNTPRILSGSAVRDDFLTAAREDVGVNILRKRTGEPLIFDREVVIGTTQKGNELCHTFLDRVESKDSDREATSADLQARRQKMNNNIEQLKAMP